MKTEKTSAAVGRLLVTVMEGNNLFDISKCGKITSERNLFFRKLISKAWWQIRYIFASSLKFTNVEPLQFAVTTKAFLIAKLQALCSQPAQISKIAAILLILFNPKLL